MVSSGADSSSHGRALPSFCMRAVNKIAHDYVRDRVDNLGHDGKYDQKCAAPESGQLQYICIIDVQVRRQHSIEQQRTAGPIRYPNHFSAGFTYSE